MSTSDPTDGDDTAPVEDGGGGPPPSREAIVERLRRVDDPELDRSIVDLEYVDRVDVDGDRVTVAFVLPTAWCSPAFAWMMATGIRDEVGALPGVADVTVDLRDHMHAEEITTGVNERRPFQAVFPDADAGVSAVRHKLDEKARLARQHAAVEALLDAGLAPEQIVALGRDQVDLDADGDRAVVSLRGGSVLVPVDAAPLARYLEKARAVGLADDHLFADPDGDPISLDAFESVQARARAARVNVDGQGSVCAALHESRNGVAVDD
ncbi:iron-sulfur cluster assembly protein [Halomicrococcus gelatinilyticus]|uniref:iron-sulfur cluster assembly protein n=1 Tax=Halomicrococcus gelatinilyticus TaxID=1702103 RepID=UPI002E10BA4F